MSTAQPQNSRRLGDQASRYQGKKQTGGLSSDFYIPDSGFLSQSTCYHFILRVLRELLLAFHPGLLVAFGGRSDYTYSVLELEPSEMVFLKIKAHLWKKENIVHLQHDPQVSTLVLCRLSFFPNNFCSSLRRYDFGTSFLSYFNIQDGIWQDQDFTSQVGDVGVERSREGPSPQIFLDPLAKYR